MKRLLPYLFLLLPAFIFAESNVIQIGKGKKKGIHRRNMMVEIGDSTNNARKNWINFDFWDGECKFAIDLGSTGFNLGGASRILSQWNGEDRVSISKGNVDFQMYKDDDGNFEWEVVFASKPPTNSFTFNIEHSGLTFRWQDTLMDDEKTNSYRPDSAIYSYALYHATAVNLNYGVNTDSGVIRHEYETTKASHLYRPTVIDDAGWKEWATIFIDTAADTVNWTIPDSFWETAQYPVVLGPTFGNTSIGATNGNSGGVQRAFWVETGGSASGYTLDSVGIYISAISTDIGIIFGLYDWDYFTDTTVGVCFAGSGSKSGVYWTGGTDVLVNGVDEGGWFSSTDVLENSSGSPYDLSNSTGYYLVILTDATTNQMTLKYDAGGHSYEWWDGANTRDDDNFDTLLATCLSTCNSTIGSSPGSRQYSIYGVHGPYATGKAQIIMIMGHYGEVERFRPYGEPFKP